MSILSRVPPGPSRFPSSLRGFSLIELGVVLVIVGILLSLGGLATVSLIEARRGAATRSTLEQIKECLIKRMYNTNTYPSYTANLYCPPEGVAGVTSDPGSTLDVDACMCARRDAWGHQFYYIEGVADTTLNPLSTANTYVIANGGRGVTGTLPDQANSALRTKDGSLLGGVAFIIVSAGKDNRLDHSSYSGLFAGASHAATITAGTPADFTFDTPDYINPGPETQDDDLFAYATGIELRAHIME